MIESFEDKKTELIFNRTYVKGVSKEIQKMAWKKLTMIDKVHLLRDLREPPRNFLEKLSGDRDGQWSIRVNDQFRICFHWEKGNAYNVEFVDYHK